MANTIEFDTLTISNGSVVALLAGVATVVGTTPLGSLNAHDRALVDSLSNEREAALAAKLAAVYEEFGRKVPGSGKTPIMVEANWPIEGWSYPDKEHGIRYICTGFDRSDPQAPKAKWRDPDGNMSLVLLNHSKTWNWLDRDKGIDPLQQSDPKSNAEKEMVTH